MMNPHVLIVDDSADMRVLLVHLIARMGYTAVEASSGQQALDILQVNKEIGIVLLDLRMPGMDGFDVLTAMWARYGFNRPKVCVLSADRDRGAIRRAVDLGCDDYVIKPLDAVILMGKLRRMSGESLHGPQFAVAMGKWPATVVVGGMRFKALVLEVTEGGIKLQSHVEFLAEGSIVEVTCAWLSSVLEREVPATARVLVSRPRGNGYVTEMDFVGLTEEEAAHIRRVTINRLDGFPGGFQEARETR